MGSSLAGCSGSIGAASFVKPAIASDARELSANLVVLKRPHPVGMLTRESVNPSWKP